MEKSLLLLWVYCVATTCNNVCIYNYGLWSKPEETPQIVQSYLVGIGDCDGNPPLSFNREYWHYILPYPCQYPQVFDRIAKDACQARQPANPEACKYVGYVFRKGMCVKALYNRTPPPLTLDCGIPVFWGGEHIRMIPQLRPGWRGTCVLHILEDGVTIRRSKKRGPGKTRIIRAISHQGCEPCVNAQTLKASGSVPKTCTQFYLPVCTFNQVIYKKCNGSDGIKCYRDEQYKVWTSLGNAPEPLKFDITIMPYLNSNKEEEWVAPSDMYWICGTFVYEVLPKNWSGSCVLGWIKPSFFLLPIRSRQVLGVPVYDQMGNRRKREVDTAFSNFPCRESNYYEKMGDLWNSEIVCVYGQATWAEDGTYGYRTPIYMINRIIRLQAVVDLAGQRLDKALNMLALTTDKIRTAVYQNRLALDYLLAKEGGVCGKFNLSNRCLQIDKTGQVIKQLTTEMRQLTHNADQTWKGFNFQEIFSGWFPKLPGLQAIVAFIGLIAAGCVLIPCILPIFIRTISNSLALLAERKATAQVMAMWEYERLQIKEDLC